MVKLQRHGLPRLVAIPAIIALQQLVAGCSPLEIAGGVVAGTALAAHGPAHELEQVYYLGVFDPQEQLPSTIYRVTVRGQASALSNVKFGSGWVHASFIDTLNTAGGFAKGAAFGQFTKGDPDQLATIRTGRRLMLFGPEGFREAPKDHRLVIVMGSSPEAFFNAIDRSLGVIADVQREQYSSQAAQQILQQTVLIREQQAELRAYALQVAADMPPVKEN